MTRKRVLIVLAAAALVAGVIFVLLRNNDAPVPTDSQYLDELNIQTQDPQPAGRNLTPGSL